MKTTINVPEINKRLGKTIAKYRQRNGLTQEQLAELLDIGNEAVSRMERGLIVLNVPRLIELAQIFNCHAADLLAESSTNLTEQTNHVHHLMTELSESDRELMLQFIQSFAQRLRPKGESEAN